MMIRYIFICIVTFFLTACATLGPEMDKELAIGMDRLDVIRVMGYPRKTYQVGDMLVLEYIDFMVHNSWNPDVSTFWIGLVDEKAVKIARADKWKKDEAFIYKQIKRKQ